jgi:hypothetical protein
MHLERPCETRRSRFVKIVEALEPRARERQALGTTVSKKAQGVLFDNEHLAFDLRPSFRLEAGLR